VRDNAMGRDGSLKLELNDQERRAVAGSLAERKAHLIERARKPLPHGSRRCLSERRSPRSCENCGRKIGATTNSTTTMGV
jgi:hypothetical protein